MFLVRCDIISGDNNQMIKNDQIMWHAMERFDITFLSDQTFHLVDDKTG